MTTTTPSLPPLNEIESTDRSRKILQYVVYTLIGIVIVLALFIFLNVINRQMLFFPVLYTPQVF